jgi:hypothetical protein
MAAIADPSCGRVRTWWTSCLPTTGPRDSSRLSFIHPLPNQKSKINNRHSSILGFSDFQHVRPPYQAGHAHGASPAPVLLIYALGPNKILVSQRVPANPHYKNLSNITSGDATKTAVVQEMKKPNDDPKSIHYGITPAAFIEFGWILLIVVILAASGIFRLVTWLFQ